MGRRERCRQRVAAFSIILLAPNMWGAPIGGGAGVGSEATNGGIKKTGVTPKRYKYLRCGLITRPTLLQSLAANLFDSFRR